MEFCHSYPFVTFVVLTVDQIVGHDDKILNGVFDKCLICGGEIFLDFGIKRGVRKLPQSFFLVKVGRLCTTNSVHYKPRDSHSYLLYSSSHPSHVRNSIPYSQILRLRRLGSDDSDFSQRFFLSREAGKTSREAVRREKPLVTKDLNLTWDQGNI